MQPIISDKKMKALYLFLVLSLSAYLSSDMHFKIMYQKVQEALPSASGIVKCHGFYYAIGDDAPFLFKLNDAFDIIAQYPIHPMTGDLKNVRIAKKDKPDFEALEMVSENEMIGFGSGSKSPERDEFVKIVIHDTVSVKKYKLTAFYNALKNMEILKDSELNIEAATYSNEVLYLFNRRKNVVFSVNYKDFLAFLENNAAFPVIKYTVFELPKINGIEAGFSGATISQNTGKILVTSSVENTDNAYDDGEILGSFIGVISLENTEIKSPIYWIPVNNQDKPLKVESITIDREISERELAVVLTTDSDGGQSIFLKGNLTW